MNQFNKDLKTSAAGLKIIKEHEGFRAIAYLCPAGVPTIGYGHTSTVRAEDVGVKRISKAEAERLLLGDVADAEADVRRLVLYPLDQGQFDALVSFVFNLGGARFGRSTLLRKLNARDKAGAALEFARWNKGRVGGKLVVLPGLVRRRAEEAALFMSGSPASPRHDPQPAPVIEERASLASSRTIAGAGASGVGVAAASISEASEQLGLVADVSPIIQLVFVALILAGIGLTIYARVDDFKAAHRA